MRRRKEPGVLGSSTALLMAVAPKRSSSYILHFFLKNTRLMGGMCRDPGKSARHCPWGQILAAMQAEDRSDCAAAMFPERR